MSDAANTDAGSLVAQTNPYAAIFSSLATASQAPPSAANLSGPAYSPVNISPTALNLGSILQPYEGSTANGAAGVNVASPFGSIKSFTSGSGLYIALAFIGVLAFVVLKK